MTRVDDLQKKYPMIPQDIVLKWEFVSHGVRDRAQGGHIEKALRDEQRIVTLLAPVLDQ
ncbi:MAG: hypothetical protein HY675_18265, partial [Chloroflexi bacterium]|nr:hypothetical protein [Chloroflexota bacterium]